MTVNKMSCCAFLYCVMLAAPGSRTARADGFQDDFRKNSLNSYKLSGNYKWKPGSFILAARADVQRVVECGQSFEFKVSAQFQGEPAAPLGDMLAIGVVEGSNAIYLALRQRRVEGKLVGEILVRHVFPGRNLERMTRNVRSVAVPQGLESGTWTLRYRFGLLEVNGPTGVSLKAFVEPTGYEGIQAVTINFRGNSLELKELAVTTREKGRTLTDEEQKELAAADADAVLADKARKSKDYPRARDLLEGVVQTSAKILGESCPTTAKLRRNLGDVLYELGRYEEAQQQLIGSARRCLGTLGPEHPELSAIEVDLGRIKTRIGDYAAATELLEKAVGSYIDVFGEENPATAGAMNSLGGLYNNQRLYGQAEKLLRRSLSVRESLLPGNDPEIAYTLSNLGVLLMATGRSEDAVKNLERAVKILAPLGGEQLAVANNALAYALLELKEYKRASELFWASIELS